MRALGLSNMKAVIAALPLIALAAAFFAFADAIGPAFGFLAPVVLLIALVIFLYLSGTRKP